MRSCVYSKPHSTDIFQTSAVLHLLISCWPKSGTRPISDSSGWEMDHASCWVERSSCMYRGELTVGGICDHFCKLHVRCVCLQARPKPCLSQEAFQPGSSSGFSNAQEPLEIVSWFVGHVFDSCLCLHSVLRSLVLTDCCIELSWVELSWFSFCSNYKLLKSKFGITLLCKTSLPKLWGLY